MEFSSCDKTKNFVCGVTPNGYVFSKQPKQFNALQDWIKIVFVSFALEEPYPKDQNGHITGTIWPLNLQIRYIIGTYNNK